MIKYSIITVCLNAEKTIAATLESLLSQTYGNYEHIIVDGRSSDKTLEVIGRYKCTNRRIVSEKDNGIFNAMNKGVKMATGDVINFLNADDLLASPDVLKKVADAFAGSPETQVVYGRAAGANVPENTPRFLTVSLTSRIDRKSDVLSKGMCHQRVFIRRELFETFGLIPEWCRVAGDTCWFIKAVYGGARLKYIDDVVTVYNFSGTSRHHRKLLAMEKLRCVLRNVPWLDAGRFLVDSVVKRVLAKVKRT